MKLHALCASAVALTLAFTSPAPAADINRDFVGLMSISFAVSSKCSGYEVDGDGFRRWADQNGADVDTYAPAVVNALGAIIERDYDRSQLIPKVTQFVRADLQELMADFNKLGTAGFCKKYAPLMASAGFVHRK